MPLEFRGKFLIYFDQRKSQRVVSQTWEGKSASGCISIPLLTGGWRGLGLDCDPILRGFFEAHEKRDEEDFVKVMKLEAGEGPWMCNLDVDSVTKVQISCR